MKKISIFVTILAVVMIASAAFAQAVIPAPAKNDRVATLEEATTVTENGQVVASDKRTTKLVIPNVAASGEADAAVKRLEGRLYGTKKKPGGTFGDLSRKMDAAANAASSAANGSNAVTRELAKVPGALQNQTAAINNNSEAIRKVDSSSFWRTIWIILAIVIAGLILGWFICHLLRRNRRQEDSRWTPMAQDLNATNRRTEEIRTTIATITPTITETASGVNEVLETVKTGFAEMRKGLDELPERTANAVQAINPGPFEFDVAGHHVSYQSPAEGIMEGYYRTLQVADMPDGKDHPETFERQAETKRGIALNYVRGTLKKFLEGRIKGTAEETLIIYLRDTTREIKIRKIN